MMAARQHKNLIDILPPLRGKVEANGNLANMIWFRTGGTAEVLVKPADADDLMTLLSGLPSEVLVNVVGVGSNMLVRDGGVEGVVIKLGKPFGHIAIDGELITAGAGAMDVTVAAKAAEAGLSGVEFLRGIPGTIGGALRMNAGAYGREVADCLHSAQAIDRKGVVYDLNLEDMGFSYRKSKIPEDWIFTSATFKGHPEDKDIIKGLMKEIMDAREDSQPLRTRTGGSTFKNPDPEKSAGRSAWQLVDEAGCRGLKVGGAQVSTKHCNFLINLGNATGADIENLGEKVREAVKEKTGVTLDWEIRRLGNKDLSNNTVGGSKSEN